MMTQWHKRLLIAALVAGGFGLASGDVGAQEPVWKRVRRNIGLERENGAEAPAQPEAGQDSPTTATVQAEPVPAGDVAIEAPTESPAEAPAANDSEPGVVGLPQAADKGGNINFGSEAAETGVVKSVLDDEILKNMLGQNPRFVYAANTKPDPMVYPPIRREAIRSELESKALVLLQQMKFTDWTKNGSLPDPKTVTPESVSQVLSLYQQIRDLNDTRFNALADRQIASVAQFQTALGMEQVGPTPVNTPTPSPTPELVLPVEIEQNTLGVLSGESGSLALVGDATLRQGDQVPGFPEVTVAQIDKGQVTFEVSIENQTKRFDVEVKGFLTMEESGNLTQLRKKTTTRKRR